MFTEENKTIVRRFFEEGPSKGNLTDADELLSPDFVLHVPLPVPLQKNYQIDTMK